MHEAAIVSGLMEVLAQQAARHGVDHISRVRLKVGQLKAVEPHALIGCFEMFAKDTMAEGAELMIETVPGRALCRACGAESEIQRFRFRCAACGGDELTLIAGEELYIESFDT